MLVSFYLPALVIALVAGVGSGGSTVLIGVSIAIIALSPYITLILSSLTMVDPSIFKDHTDIEPYVTSFMLYTAAFSLQFLVYFGLCMYYEKRSHKLSERKKPK